MINDSDAVPEETFAFILSSFNGNDLEDHQNDYNFIVTPNKNNQLSRDSLAQCFYICKVTKDNLMPGKQKGSTSDIQVKLFFTLLDKFIKEHPEIEVINDGSKVKIVKDGEAYKIITESILLENNELGFTFNTKVKDIQFDYVLLDDWEDSIRCSVAIYNNEKSLYLNLIYNYIDNVVVLTDSNENQTEIELTDDSDKYTVFYNGIFEENEISLFTYSFIDFLNNYDLYLDQALRLNY